MILGILFFLLSTTETDTFTPLPSGYSISQRDGVSTVAVEKKDGFFSAEPGAPFLPLVSRVFILPGRCEVLSLSVNFEQPAYIEKLPAPLAGAPVVQPTGRSNHQALTASTASIPSGGQSFSFHTGHILDAYTIVSCSVNPWIYDSGTQELGLSASCTIELDWVSTCSQADLSECQIEMLDFRIASLADRYGVLLTQTPYLPGTDSGIDYLIITSENLLDETAILENLLDRKEITFQTLTVQAISGNWEGIDIQEDIRNCIRHYAFNQGTAFVLLAGDETVVPVREIYTECEGLSELAPSDLYYADLDGSWDHNGNGIYGEYADSLDLYADVLLGRLLFSTSAGATAVFEKNTIYASVSTSETWYKSAVLCGAMLFKEIGYVGAKGCEIMAEEFPDDFTLTRAYELSVGDYPDTYFPVLYDGAGWNHYAGHGNDRGVYWAGNGAAILNIARMDGFSEEYTGTNEDANPGRTGIHTCIGCHTGDFTDPGVCLPDTLLTLPNGGGVAGMFNTSWGWEGYWPEIGSSERLCNNTVEQVYQQKAPSLGLAYTTAKDLEIPMMTGPYDRVMQSVIAYSAFMDPSLKVLGVSSFNPIPPSPFQVVMLSPNPLTDEVITFKVTGISTTYDIAVFNLAGRVVESLSLPQNTMHSVGLESFPVGVYFVSARAPGGVIASGSFVLLR
ncbi:MAG: T9SS type A sorting domain-containing protein [Candidatus Sabulitectum sp.]|nr:T9SS type A sorting domain-containing protein [Candidatus Sabulitectum sp.]